MSKYLQIQIPKPCTQSWNEMNAGIEGRFCNSCRKTVIDFTLMSDDDLANFFKKNKGHTCGRFTQEQLNYDICIPQRKIPWLKYFFQITIPAFLFSLKTTGQTQKLSGEVNVSTFRKTSENDQPKSTDTGRIIKGKVVDENNVSVPGASVIIKHTQIGVITDMNGDFSIRVFPGNPILLISSIGFTPLEVNSKANLVYPLVITTKQAILGEVVTFVGFTTTKRKSKPATPVNNTTCSGKPSFTIFPNPVVPSSIFNIKWKNAVISDQVVDIYNQSGNLMQHQVIRVNKKLNEQRLDINQLLPGSYIIKIFDNKTHAFSSQEFIIQ